MKRFASLLAAFGLATAGSTAFAAQPDAQIQPQNPSLQPVQMSDAQLDNVAAGAIITGGLIDIVVSDVTVVEDGIRVLNNSLNDLTVQVPVQAAVGAAVAVLGNAAAVAQQLGRQRTSN